MAKNKKGKVIKLKPPTIKQYIKEHARKLPIIKCYAIGDFEHGIVEIIVCRQKRNENLLVGIYLVDGYCLGLKRTHFAEFENFDDFEQNILYRFHTKKEVEEIDPIYAMNYIYGAIEFAEDAGFEPVKGFEITEYLLDDVENLEFIDIKFGKKGKYFYVQGPDDKPDAIMAILAKNVARENYDYLFEIPSLAPETFPEIYFDKIAELNTLELDDINNIFNKIHNNLDEKTKAYYKLFYLCALVAASHWGNNDLKKLYKDKPKEIIAETKSILTKKLEMPDDSNIDISNELVKICVENLINFDSPYFTILDDFVTAIILFNKVDKEINDNAYNFLIPFTYKRNNMLTLIGNAISKKLFGNDKFSKLDSIKFEIVAEKLIELYQIEELEEQWENVSVEFSFLKYLYDTFLPVETHNQIKQRLRGLKDKTIDIWE